MEKKITIHDLAKNIGKKGIWTWTARNGAVLQFEVEIRNVEMIYGAPHYTIAPVAGTGEARVRDAIKINE